MEWPQWWWWLPETSSFLNQTHTHTFFFLQHVWNYSESTAKQTKHITVQIFFWKLHLNCWLTHANLITMLNRITKQFISKHPDNEMDVCNLLSQMIHLMPINIVRTQIYMQCFWNYIIMNAGKVQFYFVYCRIHNKNTIFFYSISKLTRIARIIVSTNILWY